MDNLIKLNQSWGGAFQYTKYPIPLIFTIGKNPFYNLPNVDCYALLNVYQLTSSHTISFTVDDATVSAVSGTVSSGSWNNTCFIAKLTKDSAAYLKYTNSSSDSGSSSGNCLFLTKKPTLIDSKAVVNGYGTFTTTPTQDLICTVNGFDDNFTITGAKYQTVCKLLSGNTVFYIPKSSETITITYGKNGVMNLFEL